MGNAEKQVEMLQAAWTPTPEYIRTTNIAWLMQNVGVNDYDALHRWSVEHREDFWRIAIERLSIRFQMPAEKTADFSAGVEHPRWLPGAKMNIVDSCFQAPPDSVAIHYQPEGGTLQSMSVAEMKSLVDRVAANLRRAGFKPGDAIAIFMPMTVEAVASYLGIVKAGCVVVGVADSFRPKEIVARLRIAEAKAVITQDVTLRGGKSLPLFASLVEADAPPAIVIPAGETLQAKLRPGDFSWQEFLQDVALIAAEPRDPEDPSNILFSSGTTGEPKAIPWNQTTPIKCGVDSHFHQNIQPGDVLVWPTNLGWMMGPWVIYSSLLNRASMGLYYGAPYGKEFGRFVQDCKATILGVIPSIVKTWRTMSCLDGADWTGVKLLSSTGECSNVDDMRWLMGLTGGKPLVEYCGGTEIGGAYITATVTKPIVPSTFNTPVLGLDLVILDDDGKPADEGELFLVPPSIGLSTTLLNKDHHEIYFTSTPKGPHGETLRRHGDQMQILPGGYWRGLGRADDTMNLGGIKVSSAEIERTLQSVPEIVETAAIAVACEQGGPSQLVIYAVCRSENASKDELLPALQAAIKRDLNPLFKIYDLVIVPALPRTASNKVMRRELRQQYGGKS